MQAPEAVGRIVELVRDLRKRCAWDAAQTRETLRSYLVEEVLELDQAIAVGDPKKIKDELGDLVLHLAFQIVLGEESGQFGAEDVTKAIESKMWRRHPGRKSRGRAGAAGDRRG
jgi:NTP pyrophosphatase (non-canonical NTP hydrolase)